MLLIKILTGPQAGQVVSIQEGVMSVGRSPDCELALVSTGVSKRHAEISFDGRRVIIKDLNSSNGTFVNGIQVRKKTLQAGDKIAFHDVFVEVVSPNHLRAARTYVHPGTNAVPFPQYQQPMPQQYQQHPAHGNAALNAQFQQAPNEFEDNDEYEDEEDYEPETFMERVTEYFDEVVLPGVLKLPQMLDFKWVLGIFMGAFIILVTSLSTIPLLRILKASVERESQEHALTIAKTLVEINAVPLSQGINTGVSVAWALERANVKKAYVISNVDGAIISPAAKAGSYPDLAFVHRGRKLGQESVEQVDGDTVVAMAPFEFYNPETGSRGITAYSVVVFDMAALAVDDGRTLSLFIQTLFIAILIGGILGVFLYRMIHYPIASLNQQLNDSLKNNTSTIEVDYEFEILQELGNNISSALSRTNESPGGDSGGALSFEADRFQEMSNVVQLIGFGALAINANDKTVTAMNEAFEEATRIHSADLISQPVSSITDQALKANLEDLIARSELNPDQIITDNIDFGGDDYQIALSTIQGSQAVAYYVCVLFPAGAEEGQES